MLKKFVLSNFKNFRDEIKIDFEDIAGYQFSTDCISDNIITKMLIYGKNGAGILRKPYRTLCADTRRR